MRLALFLSMLLLAASACDDAPTAAAAGSDQARGTRDAPLRVSMIQLIASPAAYDGQWVQLAGYYRNDFEGNAVYLHRQDFEQGLYRNGLWVTTSHPDHHDGYILLAGRFDATMTGHLGLWSGSITDVTRVIAWPPRPATQPAE